MFNNNWIVNNYNKIVNISNWIVNNNFIVNVWNSSLIVGINHVLIILIKCFRKNIYYNVQVWFKHCIILLQSFSI